MCVNHFQETREGLHTSSRMALHNVLELVPEAGKQPAQTLFGDAMYVRESLFSGQSINQSGAESLGKRSAMSA